LGDAAGRPLNMVSGQTVRVERLDDGVHHLVLARPAARNALDAAMIAELANALDTLATMPEPELRLVVLRGEGDTLCSGADLGYMRGQGGQGRETNRADADLLPGVFRRLAAMPVPVVGVLRGAAMGGGLGLVACCDFVIAEDTAVVALPEVRLGLLPAVIGPYLLRKIGLSHTQALAFSGRRHTAEEAQRMGLVHQVVTPGDLPLSLAKVVVELLRGGPQAMRRTKHLYLQLSPLPSAMVETLTAATIAEARASDEARAGIEAFLARQRAPWVPEERKKS
jgi:methylglutaconyl-CoA hydratase